MRRKKKIIIYCCIIAFIVYAVFTGGLVVSSSHDFGGQRDIRLASGLNSDVYFAPRFTIWGIPFVFYYFGVSEPYSLRLQIWDSSKTYSLIKVTYIVLKYTDGKVVYNTNKWTRQLKPYTQYNSSSSGDIETEMMMLSDTIDDLVGRHTGVVITIKGCLVTTSSEEVDFSISETFEMKDGFYITTFWKLLAGI
jgi:hypothetical protein